MKKITIFMLALALFSLQGCSDNETANEPKDKCDATLTLEEAQKCCYLDILENWTQMEVNGNDTTYTFKCLRPDDTLPNVYYWGVGSAEEAKEFFEMYFGGDEMLRESKADGTDVNLGEYGQIRYTPGGDDPRAFATVRVQLKKVPQAATLYLVPQESMNAGNDSDSPFSKGDIVKVKKDGVVKYYICTVEYQGSTESGWGCLMRFRDKDELGDHFVVMEDHFKTWVVPFDVYNLAFNVADNRAVDGFIDLMCNEDRKSRRDAMWKGFEENKEKYGVANREAVEHAMNYCEWDGHSYFISQSYDDGYCWKCCRYPKRLTLRYFYIYHNKVVKTSVYMSHEWVSSSFLPDVNVFYKKGQTDMIRFNKDLSGYYVHRFTGNYRVTADEEIRKVWPPEGR